MHHGEHTEVASDIRADAYSLLLSEGEDALSNRVFVDERTGFQYSFEGKESGQYIFYNITRGYAEDFFAFELDNLKEEAMQVLRE